MAPNPLEVRKPPQTPLTYDHTPEELLQMAERAINAAGSVYERICSTVNAEEATFDNVLLPLALSSNELDAAGQYIALFQGVSPDPAVRQASSDALKLFDGIFTESVTRQGLFDLVDSVMHKAPTLDAESQRYLERKHQAFLRNGLGLQSGPQRDRAKEITLSVGQCIIDFNRTLSEHCDSMYLTRAELEGVPQSVVDGLEVSPDGSNVKLTFKKPDVTAILKHAHCEETRKRVYIGDNNIGLANLATFKECVMLRDEMSRLFGYRNFVEYAFAERMAESQQAVEAFLNELHASLKPAAIRARETLLEMKLQDLQARGEDKQVDSHGFYLWDVAYYEEKRLAEQYQVSHTRIAEYFPAQVAIRGMLDIFEKLFGLEIIQEKLEKGSNLVWNPDVQMFAVWDSKAEGGAFNGYLYTDIYPRKGKYTHNANFNISPGYTDSEGKRHHVSTALVCNLNYPSESKPSLLQHRQLITLFHELGHGMHDLLSRTRYSKFHGHQEIALDFREMPSQMLENWCWVPEVLADMSRHYSYLSPEYRQAWLDANPDANGTLPSEAIPMGMVQSLIRARNVTMPLEEVRQVSLAKFDLAVYGQDSAAETEALDPSVAYNQIKAEVGLVPGPESVEAQGYRWGHGHIRSTHFIWGNEAAYYGYKYSQVFSADLFHTAFKEDPMNDRAGRRYRYMVLEKGASQDEMKTLRDFLGREPSIEAFRSDLGA